MIQACKEHLKKALEAAGVRRVYTQAEQLKQHQALPYAVLVEEEGDELTRDGTPVAQELDAVAGARRVRRRMYRRTVRIELHLAAKTEAEAERLLAQALIGAGTSFLDPDGNAIGLRVLGIRPEDDASLLKQQAGLVARVACDGGLYADQEVPVVGLAQGLVVEPETIA